MQHDTSQLVEFAVSVHEVGIKTRETKMPGSGDRDIGCHDEFENRVKWWSRTKRRNSMLDWYKDSRWLTMWIWIESELAHIECGDIIIGTDGVYIKNELEVCQAFTS